MPCTEQGTSFTEINGISFAETTVVHECNFASESGHNNGTCSEERRVTDCNGTQQQSVTVQRRDMPAKCTPNPQPSFNALHPLPGEELENENWVDMDHCRLFLTHYRIIIAAHNQSAACAIPLTDVESLEAKDIVGLQITCKDGRIIKLRAENSETAIAWYKKLVQKTCMARNLDGVFAFSFCANAHKDRPKLLKWLRIDAQKEPVGGGLPPVHMDQRAHCPAYEALSREFRQLRLQESAWRISTANRRFELCSTYPQYLIVPNSVTDEELKIMRYGRYYHRLPTLVWRFRQNGAVLLRSSQPTIGFFGMTNEHDVKLYEKIRNTATTNEQTSKFLIVDARSYTAAWANRAKGGGFEASDYYANAEVVFMGLPNIHNIRYSFHQLRQLLNSNIDPNTYLQALQSTLWLQNIGQLFTAVERCLNALCNDGVSVLVHCSDGWDRTTQIVSLCMLIADPNYRTLEGFKTLVQRQWIEFGHKFADRNGVLNGDENEKSPVFLQWLDCVYQLWEKNPDSFQFNRRYLMKLVQHTYSGLFGSFLFNSIKDAVGAGCALAATDPPISNGTSPVIENGINVLQNGFTSQKMRAFSVWDYLGKHNEEFQNPAFNGRQRRQLVYPKYVPELLLWRDAYCCTPAQSFINNPDENGQNPTTAAAATSSGSSQDVSSEKSTNTLSRSQSASSLTSLEQNMPSFHGSGFFNTSVGNYTSFSTSVGTVHGPTTRLSDSTSTGSLTELQSQKFLDSDGLSRVPMMFEDRMIERMRIESQHSEFHGRKPSPITGTPGSHRDLTVGMNGKMTSEGTANVTRSGGRTRNESVDSTSFEFVSVGGDCCRQKHNSSTSSSTVSCLPSSFSSTCTTLSEYCPSGATNGHCKNEVFVNGENSSTPEFRLGEPEAVMTSS